MSSLNLCQFIGNLGRDPEVRHTQSGDRVVNLNLAVTERWKTKSGEKQEKTEWVRVTIWNDKIGEIAERFCKKGDKIYISGSMQTRKWTDQSGAEKYSTEIVLQRFRGELVLLGGSGGSSSSTGDQDHSRQDDLDDDIPF